jgi:hypothetical protein
VVETTGLGGLSGGNHGVRGSEWWKSWARVVMGPEGPSTRGGNHGSEWRQSWSQRSE